MVTSAETRVTRGELQLNRGEDNLVVIYTRTRADLGRRHALDGNVITIGRDPDNAISLESDSVSRFHARIDLRQQVESSDCLFEGQVIRVTVSIGAAELTEGMDATALVKAADDCLYRAKTRGRNRVCS